MATYRCGVPLESAIIVRHTPNDANRSPSTRANQGAISVSRARSGLDYVGRYAKWEEKGDIERAVTRDDLGLMDRYRDEAAQGHTLDYIARMGAFASKGAENQVDASLWNQYGPVDVDEATRQMKEDGGAFIDSIVTVKREYAHALGLESKQDMQRLLRTTWTDAVMQWGMIRHAADVRWVAAYHTDAAKSIHCHVFTWSARGEIPEHATVGRDETRAAKEVIYRRGYAAIRAERDAHAAFLRDLSVLEAKRQLGHNVERSAERRVTERGERGGWEERLSKAPDVDPAYKDAIGRAQSRLEASLASGEGRLAKNYAAQSAARDQLKLLREASPSFGQLHESIVDHADAKAAMKGFGEGTIGRREFVKGEVEEVVRRQTNGILRANLPERERTLRHDLQPLDARGDDGRANISFSRRLECASAGDSVTIRIPGTGANGPRVSLPTSDTALINRDSGRLASIDLGADYTVTSHDGRAMQTMSGAEIVERFGEADMDRIARANPHRPGADALAAREGAESRKRREDEQLARARAAMNPALLAAHNDFSTKHGIPLDDSIKMGQDLSKLTFELRGSGVRSYWELSRSQREAVDRIAKTLNAKSSRVNGTIRDVAERHAAREGIPVKDAYGRLLDAAVRQTRDLVVEHAEAGDLAGAAGRTPIQNVRAMSGLADMVSSMVEAVGESSEGAARRSRQRIRPAHEQHIELDRSLSRA